ncbi:MAG: hypothetical protein J6W85_08965, partial [Lachnospiraceae bacterium]|nr:hypothetical protein [Lachnospiraceae bacterium]
DLLTAAKKSEKTVLKNTGLSVILFVISAVCFVYVWIRIGFFGARMSRNEFLACVVIGFVSTFVIFRSEGGFLQKACSSCRAFYRKGLNASIVRQFTAGIGTSSISMAVISLLLFLAMLFFSTGFSIRNYVNTRLGNVTPVDITMDLFSLTPEEFFEENGIPMDGWAADHLQIPISKGSDVTVSALLGAHEAEASETFTMADWSAMVGVMKLSDYNLIEDMYGRSRLEMADDEYAFILDFDMLGEIVNKSMEEGGVLNVSGTELHPAYDHVIPECVLMSGMEANLGIVVLPDCVIDSPDCELEVVSNMIAANYVSEEAGEKVTEKLSELGEDAVFFTTRKAIRSSSISVTVIIVFVVLYLGIVFVISSAAIIGLKMLSDSIDSASHFTILKNIGASSPERKKALFVRVASFFMFPLLLAILNTLAGVRFVRGFMSSIGMINMGQGIVLSLFIMVLIYGGYFLTTYEGCRKIVGI